MNNKIWTTVTSTLTRVGEGTKIFAKEHGSTILAAIAVVGVGVTAYTAINADTAAREALNDLPEDATTKDKVVAVAKQKEVQLCAAAGLTTVSCICGSRYLDMRQIKDLKKISAMYNNMVDIHKEYQKSVESVVTPEQKQEIENKMSAPSSYVEGVYDTGTGNVIFFFEYLGFGIKASPTVMQDAINKVQAKALEYAQDNTEFMVPFSFFLESIPKMPKMLTQIGYGEVMGFDPSFYDHAKYAISYSDDNLKRHPVTGEPYVAIHSLGEEPIPDYRNSDYN